MKTPQAPITCAALTVALVLVARYSDTDWLSGPPADVTEGDGLGFSLISATIWAGNILLISQGEGEGGISCNYKRGFRDGVAHKPGANISPRRYIVATSTFLHDYNSNLLQSSKKTIEFLWTYLV